MPPSMARTDVKVAAAISGALLLFAALFFSQTRDPMILVFAILFCAAVWFVALFVRLMRDGIPVRIVERPPPGDGKP